MIKIMNDVEGNSLKWLIQQSSSNQLYIITADHQHSEHIELLAKEMKLYIPHPITVAELLRGALNDQTHKDVLVADIDIITKYLNKAAFKGVNIVSATANCQYLNKIL